MLSAQRYGVSTGRTLHLTVVLALVGAVADAGGEHGVEPGVALQEEGLHGQGEIAVGAQVAHENLAGLTRLVDGSDLLHETRESERGCLPDSGVVERAGAHDFHPVFLSVELCEIFLRNFRDAVGIARFQRVRFLERPVPFGNGVFLGAPD